MPSKIIFLSMEEPRNRLKKIRKHLPNISKNLEIFVLYLEQHLPPKRISPQGFIRAWNHAYDNIRRGREGKKPLNSPLTNISGLEYFHILCSFRSVIDAIFPPQFVNILTSLQASNREIV